MIDPAQLTGWFEAYGPALVLYARQWLPRSSAEDAVQEAFVRLMLQSQPPGNVQAWLYRVVRNGAISQWRSGRRHEQRTREQSGEQAWFEPPPDLLDAEAATQAVQHLPAPQREIIVLRIWSGLKFQEISDLVGLPVSTVFRHYHEGLAAIRRQMGVPCKTKND